LRTEKSYVYWVRFFIHFHKLKHPQEMGPTEVTGFLNYLASERRVSASTQNQALAALLFLYKEVLGIKLPWLDGLVRAKRPQRLPTVLTREEVVQVLNHLRGTRRLLLSLIYGAGLRQNECLSLRVKDSPNFPSCVN
jgi:integrase